MCHHVLHWGNSQNSMLPQHSTPNRCDRKSDVLPTASVEKTENTSVDMLQVFVTCTRSHCLLHSMFHSIFHVMHMQFWSLIYIYIHINLLSYPSYLPIICFCLSTSLLCAYISSISITPSISLRDPASIYLFIHRSGHPSIYQYMLTQVRRLGEFDNLFL